MEYENYEASAASTKTANVLSLLETSSLGRSAGVEKKTLNAASVSDLDRTQAQHFLVRAGNVSWLWPPPGALSRHEQKALTQGRKMKRDMSEASHSEDVEIVRRGFGQHFNATYAIALLAKSRLAVIFFVETVLRPAARTNLPLALDTHSP